MHKLNSNPVNMFTLSRCVGADQGFTQNVKKDVGVNLAAGSFGKSMTQFSRKKKPAGTCLQLGSDVKGFVQRHSYLICPQSMIKHFEMVQDLKNACVSEHKRCDLLLNLCRQKGAYSGMRITEHQLRLCLLFRQPAHKAAS